MLRQFTIRTRFESEADRLRELERLVVWMHTIVIPPVLLILFFDFRVGDPRWLTVITLGVVVGVAWTALSRPLGVRGLKALAWFLIAVDSALIIMSMFLFDAKVVEVGVYFAAVLVIIEAAAFLGIAGGFSSGCLFAVATFAWMEYRQEQLGLEFPVSAAFTRGMVFIVVGLGIGIIVHGMERARTALSRRVAQVELVNRFALDAPQRNEEENVVALAELLASELACDAVWIFLHDPSTARLRVSATAGTAAASEYDAGLSMSEHAHPAIAAFTSGHAVAEKLPGDTERIGVPLRAGARNLGVILLNLSSNSAMPDDELPLLDVIAGELAQVLENVRLGEVQRETIEELRRLTELKDDFITVASHELRTPLTAMRGFVRALTDVRANPEQSERAVAAIDRQVERMHRLVEDLIAVSMIDSGRTTPMPQAVQLGELVESVWGDVDPRNDRYSFSADIAEGAAVVAADPAFLKRILDNLMANAVEFSPEGGEVAVQARVEGEGDAQVVRVEVIDHGVGIRPEELDQLFEKFVRLPSNRRPEGTGLGLYIVRGLVRAMGGTTGVSSRPGSGSCFSFTVPLVAGSPARKAQSASSPDAAGV